MDGLTFYQAAPEDAPRLAELGRRTFTEAFAHRMNPEDVAAYLDQSFEIEKVRQELSDPRSTCFITMHDGEPAGYARLYRGHTPGCVTLQPAIELVRFYTCKTWWGRGVSGPQMQVCLDLARQEGYAGLWLSSWKLNDRANAFYRKWGFAVGGETTFTVGADVQEDFILVHALTPQEPAA